MSQAWKLVNQWSAERAHDLYLAANRADNAYSAGPMADACKAYAARLREAAKLLEKPIRGSDHPEHAEDAT